MKQGKVYILGAGPGDPELITIKGKRLLEEAEVVIYDRLVGNGVLDFINPQAERIFVGKESFYHPIPQEEINQLLVNKAKSGKTVVRLKGGDPLIFGRGGEEAELLFSENIPYEVVPGITAASGVSSYAGIPLTDRRCSSGVTFVTGHPKSGNKLDHINWDALAKLDHTLVFYMGVKNLPNIISRLLENGLSSETPTAVVRCGTMPEQEVLKGTLGDIAEKVKKRGIAPPSLIIIGKVIKMRRMLNWFKHEES